LHFIVIRVIIVVVSADIIKTLRNPQKTIITVVTFIYYGKLS
jgi:hypothetical protein